MSPCSAEWEFDGSVLRPMGTPIGKRTDGSVLRPTGKPVGKTTHRRTINAENLAGRRNMYGQRKRKTNRPKM